MVRNAMWARVDLVSRDDLDGLVRLERAAADRLDPPRQVVDGPLGLGRRDRGRTTPSTTPSSSTATRAVPSCSTSATERTGEPVGAEEGDRARLRDVRQTIHDPDGHHDWVIDAVVDCDASDEAGELVLATVAMRRL